MLSSWGWPLGHLPCTLSPCPSCPHSLLQLLLITPPWYHCPVIQGSLTMRETKGRVATLLERDRRRQHDPRLWDFRQKSGPNDLQSSYTGTMGTIILDWFWMWRKYSHPIFIATPLFQGQIFQIPFIFTLDWIDDIMCFEPMSVYIGQILHYCIPQECLLWFSFFILIFLLYCLLLSKFPTFSKTCNNISHLYSL